MHGLALLIFAGVLLAGCGAGGDPEAGERLYTSLTIGRADAPGCITCHSLEPGEIKVGPSHSGVARRAAEVIQQSNYTGSATTAEGYVRESILEPDAYVEAGFAPGVMYQAYSQTLTEGELADLVAFLLTLE
jgi:nitric oxide reductase subunit C